MEKDQYTTKKHGYFFRSNLNIAYFFNRQYGDYLNKIDFFLFLWYSRSLHNFSILASSILCLHWVINNTFKPKLHFKFWLEKTIVFLKMNLYPHYIKRICLILVSSRCLKLVKKRTCKNWNGTLSLRELTVDQILIWEFVLSLQHINPQNTLFFELKSLITWRYYGIWV